MPKYYLQTALKASTHSNLHITSFDYHSQMKQTKDCLKELMSKLDQVINEGQFFHFNANNQSEKRYYNQIAIFY